MKRKTQLLSLVLTVFLFTGCTGPAVTNPPGSESADTEAISSGPAGFSDAENAEVTLVENPGDFPDYRPMIEGSVQFEEDPSRQASVEFLANGIEKALLLEDGNGLTWQLTIPADALTYPETITMMSMKNISSGLGTISGGIVLQPDGLRFAAPVTLSVKGKGIETSGLTFSGDGKGGELELPIVQRGEGGVEMKILHFSTAYATDDRQAIDSLTETAQGSIKNLSVLAKQIFKRPIEVPVPPAIPIKCHHDTEDQDDGKVAKYIKDFEKPESDLIKALLAARTTIEASTGESPDFTVELRLVWRLIKKGNMLIRQYKGQEDMFWAVAAVTLNVERQSALLGEALPEEQSFMPVLAEWAQSIAQKYLNDLVRNHEYKNIHPILKLARSAALLGSPAARDFMEKLRQALTFQLETTTTTKIGIAPSTTTYVVESKAKINALDASKTGLIGANGKGTYKSFESPLLEGSEIKMTLEQLGTSFDVLVGIEEFNPCQSDTFTILVDRFGAESETITAIVPEVPSTSKEKPVVQMACEKGFADMKRAPMFAFSVTLRDGQKVTVEQTFNASGKGMDIEFKVKLTHTP